MRIEGRKVERKGRRNKLGKKLSLPFVPICFPPNLSLPSLSFYLPPPILLSHLPHSLANSLFNKLYIRSNKNFEAPCAEI